MQELDFPQKKVSTLPICYQTDVYKTREEYVSVLLCNVSFLLLYDFDSWSLRSCAHQSLTPSFMIIIFHLSILLFLKEQGLNLINFVKTVGVLINICPKINTVLPISEMIKVYKLKPYMVSWDNMINNLKVVHVQDLQVYWIFFMGLTQALPCKWLRYYTRLFGIHRYVERIPNIMASTVPSKVVSKTNLLFYKNTAQFIWLEYKNTNYLVFSAFVICHQTNFQLNELFCYYECCYTKNSH